MSISTVLKQRRKELNLTLAEIAKQVGVSEATVQRWESGNIKNLRHDRIGLLAEALDVAPSVLMGWEDEKSPTPVVEDGTSILDSRLSEALRRLTPEQKQRLLDLIESMFQQ